MSVARGVARPYRKQTSPISTFRLLSSASIFVRHLSTKSCLESNVKLTEKDGTFYVLNFEIYFQSHAVIYILQ